MNRSSELFLTGLLAMVTIPLAPSSQWIDLKFSSIPKNKVTFTKSKLHIQVNKSASPLIYKFDKLTNIKGFKIIGQQKGEPFRIPASAMQGKEGYDDFVIRLGLVVKGKRTLGWLEKKLAPEWVKTLFSLAPKGVGVKSLQFYSMGSQKKIEGSKLTLDKKNRVTDEILGTVDKNGKFVLEKSFPKSKEVLALWLSTDGDDTGSKFNLEITSVEIETD